MRVQPICDKNSWDRNKNDTLNFVFATRRYSGAFDRYARLAFFC